MAQYGTSFGYQHSITVHWIKSIDDDWLPLERVNLSSVTSKGVYIIWHDGDPSRVVRVGQGDINDRLCCHRKDNEILSYGRYGTLRVTWASVSADQRDGVEKYLADTWHPLVGDCFPDAYPIAVNSPFS